jgi:hypothetical protein
MSRVVKIGTGSRKYPLRSQIAYMDFYAPKPCNLCLTSLKYLETAGAVAMRVRELFSDL